MKIGRLEIGFWEYHNLEEKRFIWFEYLHPGCGCHLLTVCNILFVYYDKECYNRSNEQNS
jgi:hypothetical protein